MIFSCPLLACGQALISSPAFHIVLSYVVMPQLFCVYYPDCERSPFEIFEVPKNAQNIIFMPGVLQGAYARVFSLVCHTTILLAVTMYDMNKNIL